MTIKYAINSEMQQIDLAGEATDAFAMNEHAESIVRIYLQENDIDSSIYIGIYIFENI
jgi:hypothetical protein